MLSINWITADDVEPEFLYLCSFGDVSNTGNVILVRFLLNDSGILEDEGMNLLSDYETYKFSKINIDELNKA